MSAQVLAGQKVYGLFELDDDNTVLYSRLDDDGGAALPSAGFNGQDFFRAAPFLNAEELRQAVDDFRASGAPARSVTFTCHYEDGPEQVKVLLARLRERSDAGRTKSILAHIRKV